MYETLEHWKQYKQEKENKEQPVPCSLELDIEMANESENIQ